MSIYLDTSQTNTKPINLSKPSLIGTFRTKLTSKSELLFDDEFFVIYKHRFLMNQLDLERGYANYIKDKKFCNHFRLKCLLKWMREPQQQVNADVENANFICTDANLSLLLNSFYDTRLSYHILAEKLNDKIYIKTKKMDYKEFDEEAWSLRKYCELQFRKLYTKVDDGTLKENRFNENVPASDNFEDFEEKINYVLITELGKHKILFTEEVDSLAKSQDDATLEEDHRLSTVKFKLAKMPKYEGASISSDKKRFWWAQNVFGCVKKLVVGLYRFDRMIVENVLTLGIDELKHPLYNQEAGLNNLESILTFIESSFKKLNTNLLCLKHYPFSKELKCQKGTQNVITF